MATNLLRKWIDEANAKSGTSQKYSASGSTTKSSAVNTDSQPATTSSAVNKTSSATGSLVSGVNSLVGNVVNGVSKAVSNSSNSSSGSSGSKTTTTTKNSPYTAPVLGNNYDANTDYQTIINNAVANGDYYTAAKAEQLRNQKIISEGMNYDRTNTYGGYLDGTGIDYSIIGQNQMNNGASKSDVEATLLARLAKIGDDPNLSQYASDYVQQLMEQYVYGDTEAEEFEWEEEMPTYDSKWTPEMEELLYAILNRGDFSYDAVNDPLYQQYREQYLREGDRARSETLADVAASAGGMNSYAVTAASQAQNYYNSQLADKIPELYNIAYQKYLNDKEGMVQDLGLLQNMDATAYNRYRDTVNDYYNDRNFAYKMYQDDVAQGNWQTEFDYNAYLNNKNLAYNNSWANKEFDANQEWKEKEWEANQAQQKLENERYDDALAKENADYEQKKAYDEVWAFIDMGVMPNTDTITKSGMDEEKVRSAVNQVRASLGLAPISAGTTTTGVGYDNGSLTTDQVKQLQSLYGVTDDGKWGAQSRSAAGGLSADEAWKMNFGDIPAPGTTLPTLSPSAWGYNNGRLTTDQVKQLQTKVGVTDDGKWGAQSVSAAGGLSADEAWKKYFGDLPQTSTTPPPSTTTPPQSTSTPPPSTTTPPPSSSTSKWDGSNNYIEIRDVCNEIAKKSGTSAALDAAKEAYNSGALDQTSYMLIVSEIRD